MSATRDAMVAALATAETGMSDAAAAVQVVRDGIVEMRRSQRSSDTDNTLDLQRVATAIVGRWRGLGLAWVLDLAVDDVQNVRDATWAAELTAKINALVP